MTEAPRQPGAHTDEYDYDLPSRLIAQTPAEPRDSARLLVLNRSSGSLSHHVFSDLDRLLAPGDLLVANRTRVLPARLKGRRPGTGGHVEVLLLRQIDADQWEALVRPGRRLRPGAQIELYRDQASLLAEVGSELPGGARRLRVFSNGSASPELLELGEAPLPPYIAAWVGDPEGYQTVYGDRPGSAAAPTAGLHFTPELLNRLRSRGVRFEFVTLHVGTDTFRPIRSSAIAEHEMHAEWAEVKAQTLASIRSTRGRGGRVVVVGTTTVRALESAAPHAEPDRDWSGWTRLYIQPGYRFRSVDLLLTNFHLPRSTLLVLVSAFADRPTVLHAYREAINRSYRFYSFGDAMLIL